jgi:F0F1-type ATP synthase membrane subunit b/b'
VAAFVAFGTTVYKFAGGAIAKSLDERQEVRNKIKIKY